MLCVVVVVVVELLCELSGLLSMRLMVAGDVPSRLAISRQERPAMLSVMASAESCCRVGFVLFFMDAFFCCETLNVLCIGLLNILCETDVKQM